MYDSNSKGISYTAGFFILIGFVIAALLLAGLVSIPIWTIMTGTNFKKMTESMSDPAYADAYKVIQCVTAVIGFFLPAFLTAYLLNKKPAKLLGFAGRFRMNQIVLVAVIMFIGLFVSTGLSYFNDHIPLPAGWKETFDNWERNYSEGVESLVGFNNIGEYLMALFIMAFLPAICEETLFRGGLQNFLTRSTRLPWLSILIVSIIFSAVHGSYYGFLSRMFLGILLGLIYQYSGKLWLCIIGHFVNNAIAVTALYYFTRNGKSLKDAMNDNAENYWGIIALPVVIALLVWFYQLSKKDKDALTEMPPVQNTPGDIFPS